MQIVFLDAVTVGKSISTDMIEGMLSHLGDVIIYETTSREEAPERISDADIIITNKVVMDSDLLKYAKNLKLLCECATGFDNIDLNYCRENGIDVRNVRGYSTDSVAQVTAAMVLSLVSRLNEYDSHVKNGFYTKGNTPTYVDLVYHEISGMKWGIIGAGAIGKRVMEIAKVLGAEVMIFSRTVHKELNHVSMDELCAESDIITVHVPLNDGTRGLINSQTLSKMKRNVILINAARGAVFDEEAVTEAVEAGQIGGLGVDVYSTEPMSVSSPYQRILNYKNVMFTPHMAWGSHEARIRCIDEVKRNIEDFKNKGNRNSVFAD